MLLEALSVPVAEFERATGWAITPEGACLGEICVPLPAGAVTDGILDVAAVAEATEMPLVHDERFGIWAIGPWSGGGRALSTAVAPELTLPDVDGNEFSLSSLRGQKVLLLAWAPY